MEGSGQRGGQRAEGRAARQGLRGGVPQPATVLPSLVRWGGEVTVLEEAKAL